MSFVPYSVMVETGLLMAAITLPAWRTWTCLGIPTWSVAFATHSCTIIPPDGTRSYPPGIPTSAFSFPLRHWLHVHRRQHGFAMDTIMDEIAPSHVHIGSYCTSVPCSNRVLCGFYSTIVYLWPSRFESRAAAWGWTRRLTVTRRARSPQFPRRIHAERAGAHLI